MSKPVLQFDDVETYSRLMDEISTINNVAFLIQGKVDEHLSTRLTAAGAKAHELLTRNVLVGKDHRDRLDSLFDKEGNVIMDDDLRDGKSRAAMEYIELDRAISESYDAKARGEATWAPDRDQEQYGKEKGV